MIFIMNFKNILSKSWIIISFFLVFCSAGKLPGNDRLVIGKCYQSTLYPFFKEQVRGKLSVAEFLGFLCKKYKHYPWDFDYQIEKNKKENEVINLSNGIKKCMQLKSKSQLFYKYKGFATKRMNEDVEAENIWDQGSLKSEYDSDNEELPKPGTPESEYSMVASSEHLQRPKKPSFSDNRIKLSSDQGSLKSEYDSDDEELPKPHSPKSKSPIVAPSDDSERQHHKKLFNDVLKEVKNHIPENDSDSTDEANEVQNFTDFYYLTTVLCESPEFVSFDELEDEQDKSKALSCSANCVNNFFQNIQNQLDMELDTLETTNGIGMDSEFSSLDYFTTSKISHHKLDLELDIDTLEHTKGISMDSEPLPLDILTTAILISPITKIQDINVEAEPWLLKYEDTYLHLVKHFNSMQINKMNFELRNIYFNYKSCVRWECAMKTLQDIPMSQLTEPDENGNVKYSIFRVFAEKPEDESSSEDDL